MGRRFKTAKISEAVVKGLATGDIVMDTEEPGFGIRCQGARRVFFLRKHARGRRHFSTIGEYGTGGLTITSARDKAKRLVIALRDGLSPAEQRAREKSMPTIASLAEEWMIYHVEAKLKPATARLYRSSLRASLLPAIGRVRIDALSPNHIAQLHHGLRAHPYAANRAIAVLSKMMSYAERKGYRPHGSNPVRGLERFREEKRERFLSAAELARLGAALRAPETVRNHSPFALAAIRLLILTGARLREVLNLRWSEVDLERGLLLLGDSKTGKKAIVLGEAARELLSSLPRTPSALVFPGAQPDKSMHDVRKAWRRVTTTAGFGGLRIHDLRHHYASACAGLGASLPMIGHLLGHSQPATTARYTHLVGAPVRDLADRAAGAIAAALGESDAAVSARELHLQNLDHSKGRPA